MKSTRWRLVTKGFLLWLLVWSCHASWAQEPVMQYTVRPGDSLSKIARQHLSKAHPWQDLARRNRLPNVDLLPIGTRIDIPVAWLAAKPAPASLLSYFGKVEIGNAEKGWKQAAKGARLHVGDGIRLGANSSARMELADRSVVVLQPHATLHLDTISLYAGGFMSDTRLRLQTGRIEVNANPDKRDFQRFQVITPSAVTAVRGTQFTVEATEARTLMLTTEGQVEILNERGSELVAAGFASVAYAGREPSPAIVLKPAPVVQAETARFVRLPVAFAIGDYAVDKLYVAQVERVQKFPSLIYEKTIDQEAFDLEIYKNGQYNLRLWSMDEFGLPSQMAVFPFELALSKRLLGKPLKLGRNDFSSGHIHIDLPGSGQPEKYILELTTDADGVQSVWHVTGASGSIHIPLPEVDSLNYHLWIWQY